jgi:DNA ligase-associated metallophosphoesterase
MISCRMSGATLTFSQSRMLSVLDDQTISGRHCSLAGEDVWLLPERALFWKRAATLIIADPHVGKPGAFRAAAIAAPEGTTIADLERLSTAIRRCGAQRLIVLGDLLHARSGRTAATMSAVEEWRTRHRSLDIVLVRGNHDMRAGDPPHSWRVTCVDEPWGHGAVHAASSPGIACGTLHACRASPSGSTTDRHRKATSDPALFLVRRSDRRPAGIRQFYRHKGHRPCPRRSGIRHC